MAFCNIFAPDDVALQIHDRPIGDGHDQLWAKCLQFLCAVPLCIGFRTRDFRVVLAGMPVRGNRSDGQGYIGTVVAGFMTGQIRSVLQGTCPRALRRKCERSRRIDSAA